ncbi:MAG: GAF domain-containing protein [Desulfobacterales bacterium]|jgi:GAF domain-containing protein|nr:GAF domain-containing protein [Desulfobacterales bacterium]
MNREKTYLKLFRDVTKAITSNLNLKAVFELIVHKVPEVVGVDAATLRLLDPSGKKLVLQAACGLSDTYLKRGPVDAEESVLKALAGTSIAVYDAAEDPGIHYHDAAREEGIKSLLVAPIFIRGKIKGILRLLSRRHRNFEPDEIEFVAAIAEQCGIAIENARAYEEQERQISYFKALAEIGKAINSTHRLDALLNLIVRRMPEVMGLKACTIRLIESAGGRLELKAAYGLSQTYLERGALDEELATHYILQGEPVVIPDARVDIHTVYHKEAKAEGVGSILAVPITVQEEPIGMMRLLTAEVRYFSAADVNFALAVAEQSGIAIQNAIAYQRMQEMAAGPGEITGGRL